MKGGILIETIWDDMTLLEQMMDMIAAHFGDRCEIVLHDLTRLSLVPIHICTTINLHNSMVLDWGDRLETIPVAARGMLV